MSMDRRQFLKIAGISSILGLGASVASATHNIWVKGLGPQQVDKNKEALACEALGHGRGHEQVQDR